MRVLITGAAGFLGSRLARRFQAAGHTVLATARRPDAALAQELGLELGASLLELDLLAEAPLALPAGLDLLIHAATANEIVSRDPVAGLQLGVVGTQRLLQAAVAAGVPRLLFFSTLQVYGTELEGEIDEETPVRCQSAYGLNHWLGEQLCALAAEQHGLAICAVRPANVYGVPDSRRTERSTLVPQCFVREALAEGRIVLRSSGLQPRNFVSTDAVADRCLALAAQMPPGMSRALVASAYTPTIRHVAELVQERCEAVLGRRPELEIGGSAPAAREPFVLRSRWPLPLLTPAAEERRLVAAIDGLLRRGASPVEEPSRDG
ncbi:MAG: SDR family oxidoreductase [Synechococcaceae cyanobacterium]|nr:SDR family oxidoreductase [Synechococcaceae cyanobacterium]